MTKKIKKDGKIHIVTFCPTCTAGDPWIIHGEMEYTMIQIDLENWKETATVCNRRKVRPKKGGYTAQKGSHTTGTAGALQRGMTHQTTGGSRRAKCDKKKATYKQKKQYEEFCTPGNSA
jgi:hypothetical protein